VNHTTASKLALWSNGTGAYVNRYGANGDQWPLTETALFCGTVGSEVLDSNGVAIPCTYRYATNTDCDKMTAKGETLLRCGTNSSSTYQGVFLISRVDGNPAFFPVDGDGFTPTSERMATQIPPLYSNGVATWNYETDASGNKLMHNFSFTSEIRYWFRYEADKAYKLDITGDDDVWVFINKQLAVDLGGIHTPVEGSVMLDGAAAGKFGLEEGKVYEVAVFQAERQSNSSTFKLTLGGFNTAPTECHPN
jgi:fibro-slime domain-containing protein